MLPALSAIILYTLAQRDEAGEDCLPYLSIAAGFFGKLRVKGVFRPDLFVEMGELLVKAQSRTSVQYASKTPPRSNTGSTGDGNLSVQEGQELRCFGLPHDVSDSIFNTPDLDDMVLWS
jgi:hypothetical protein